MSSSTCKGEFVNVSGYTGLPRPVQRPRPPIMIGGGRKRVLSLAAREADIVSIANVPFEPVNDAGLSPEQEAVRRLGYVREAAGDRFSRPRHRELAVLHRGHRRRARGGRTGVAQR